MNRPEIRSLTGLRGIAAVFVVFYHLLLFERVSGGLHNLLKHGYLSVDLFFALSGFVMALSYGEMFAKGFQTRPYLTFLARRIARIYPLYFVLTAITGLLTLFESHLPLEQRPTVGSAVINLLLLQSWGFGRSIIGPAWSISTELAAYLIFPLLTVVCLYKKKSWAIAAGCVCAALLIALAVVPSSITHVVHVRGPLDIASGTDYGALLRCVLEFTLGMLVWRLSRVPALQASMRSAWPSTVIALMILVLFAVANADIFIVLLFPALILFLASDVPPLARLLSTPFFYWLGEISYSIYLIQLLCGLGSEKIKRVLVAHHVPHPGLAMLVLYFGFVLVGASLAYRFIEKPGRSLLRRWLEPAKRPGTATSGTLSTP